MVDGAGTEVVLISSSPEVLAHHSPADSRKDESLSLPFNRVRLPSRYYQHYTRWSSRFVQSKSVWFLRTNDSLRDISWKCPPDWAIPAIFSQSSIPKRKKTNRFDCRSWKSCHANLTLDGDLSSLVYNGSMLSMTDVWTNNNIGAARCGRNFSWNPTGFFEIRYQP